jgi:hypothetical protein
MGSRVAAVAARLFLSNEGANKRESQQENETGMSFEKPLSDKKDILLC